MKKTILSLLMLALSIGAFVAYIQYNKITDDKVPPVITCEEDIISASVKVTDEELLAGVTATDDRSGDVTSSVVIEGMSNFIAENTRIVTYAAIDGNMNVGRLERTIVYTDYKEPTFSLSGPLSYVVGSKIDVLRNVSARSTLDGNISLKVRYGLESVIDNMTPGKYPVEFRVTDSCGKTSYLNTEIEIYDTTYSGIDVELKKYLTYIKVGSNFKKEDYFKGSNIEGKLTIVSEVDTKKPGTYNVDYYVNGVNASGKSRLVVVVY